MNNKETGIVKIKLITKLEKNEENQNKRLAINKLHVK